MITCPKCQHKNDAGLKFCENCGTKLTRSCPNCGSAVSFGAKLGVGRLEEASELFQKGLDYPTMMGYLNKPMFLIGSALVALSRQNLAEARGWVTER